ncbi:MAG TPA: pYEATS domain-containing protein [Chryseosolibacter sp.]
MNALSDYYLHRDNPLGDIVRVFRHLLRFVYATSALIAILLLLQSHWCLSILIMFIMVAASAWAGGAVVGFVFGIPKSKNSGDLEYADNSNLEEVSDWITKLILGLTLVELGNIPAHVHTTASAINSTASKLCGHSDFYVLFSASLIFYIVAGIGVGYLWTRINLGVIFGTARRLQLALGGGAVRTADRELLSAATITANEPLLEARQQANQNVPTNEFRNIIEKIYSQKKPSVKNDIQKGCWGGKKTAGNYFIEATYDSNQTRNVFLGLRIVVKSVDSSNPVSGQVAFFLDDTFRNVIQYVRASGNQAVLDIRAFHAFTIGARLEDDTELELDLRTLNGLPKHFYS